MKLKIVSDGLCNGIKNGSGTRLMTESGEQIEGVISIDWHMNCDRYITTAEVELIGVAVELGVAADAVLCSCGEKYNKEMACRNRIRRAVNQIYPETKKE